MKTFILLFVMLSQPVFASSFICSLKHSKKVIATATNHSQDDKNRHCTVSCMLALRCNNTEVMMIGYLKEFKDALGPGDADQEDIVADKFGIDLVRSKRAKTDKECLDQCDLQYR